MKIGIDGRLGYKEGIGRYLFELVENLAELAPDYRYILYFNAEHSDYYTQHAPRRQNIEWRFIAGAAFRGREQWNLIQAVKADKVDLYHATFEYGAPLWLDAPLILTVHDAYFLPPAKSKEYFRSFSTYLYYQLMMAYGLVKAKRVITVSNFVRNKIIGHSAFYSKFKNKISAVHNGVGSEFNLNGDDDAGITGKYGLDRYFLYVGALTNHKNIFGLLSGYAYAVRQMPDCPRLAVAGKPNKSLWNLSELLEKQGIVDKVSFLGYVPNEELPGLFRRALAFAFPSLHEGFGIPVLEAMACGTPVITSDRTALPEVAGDAALLVDPHSPEAIGNAMLNLCRDPALAAELRAKGLARAGQFSWRKMAAETLTLYRAVLSGSSH
ncbi:MULTISPECIES: glycosyltransferase family 4 protein [Methylomonas]|uniref:glycosyltransferase family 4 protein n=1 Tax=Methylomonas TaxID=416 RepID=UPI001232B003|nr:glycosyltransferase family 1 protein [Methylomonas rhizoryzae]